MKSAFASTCAAALLAASASTAFAAANPFEDVPADHWAYDAISQLAAEGVIEGYGDGSYRGDQAITRLATLRRGLVFMLWGNYAKQKGRFIDRQRHLVLTAAHPSPLSANRGGWFGNHHFSQANAYLTAQGLQPIEW